MIPAITVSDLHTGGHPHRFESIIARVSGQAWSTGHSTFSFDPGDPLVGGFLVR
jgi:proline racemase